MAKKDMYEGDKIFEKPQIFEPGQAESSPSQSVGPRVKKLRKPRAKKAKSESLNDLSLQMGVLLEKAYKLGQASVTLTIKELIQ